jgi:hypothetical protein
MLRYTGITPDDFFFFRFKTSPNAEPTRIEWHRDSNVILMSYDLVAFVERQRYARALTEAEVEGYNAAVAAAVQADGATPDPLATPTAAEAETPSTGLPVAGEGGSTAPVSDPTTTEPPPPVPPTEPPVAMTGTESASDSKTPEQLAAEQMLASMGADNSAPKKGK